ncbi:uncharacterized protein LOC128195740 [Vigna angularis]|uniref:uncharacterized protein LOC128195740 n=1 Tax=Phaseolus angularis TaxID=3914 RepID=UPI000809F6CD|nr:uncharacterized protein LOC128195740 [Vigna angularis]
MTYDLGFVVIIVRSDIATGVRGRKTFVILGCERGEKYRKYKADAVASVYNTRKCECPFRLKGKPCSDGVGWVLKVMCGHHNHELAETLVGHPYAGRCADDSEVVTDMFRTHPDAMLCRFHILKNVKVKCKMLVHSTEVWGVLMDAWENVMDCAEERLFVEYVNGLQYGSSSWPLFFEYVNQTWIIPYSTYFVKFWTNRVMHLGNTTTIVQQIGLDSSKCGCVLRRTFGVPCACELARYDHRMIPVGEFHIMWRRLHLSNVELNETESQLSIKDELKQVEERFNEVDIGSKVTIKQKLLEIVCPTLTSMVPPLHKVKKKGAQKSKVQRRERSTTQDPSYFEYVDAFHSTIEYSSVRSKLQSKPKAVKKRRVPMIDQFHSTTHPFIVDVVDVVADGHCGYRCIDALLGLGEDSWPVIRNELYKELGE